MAELMTWDRADVLGGQIATELKYTPGLRRLLEMVELAVEEIAQGMPDAMNVEDSLLDLQSVLLMIRLAQNIDEREVRS